MFVNPYIDKKTGRITFPEGASLVRHVERWAGTRGELGAYQFLDYSTERDGVARDLTWAEFSARNRAVAARLQQVCQPNDRVAILCPQSLEYLVAFYGAMYAGMIAVPLFDPSEPGHTGRLHAVLDDCTPSVVLTTTDSAEGVRRFFHKRPAKERPRVIAVDAVPDEVASTWQYIHVTEADTIAYLQYTSGSTRSPRGVQITHQAVATNLVQIVNAVQIGADQRGVSWLPFFHDMGLISIMLSSIIGRCGVFMTPAAFVRRPFRWISGLGVHGDDRSPSFGAAPNFAFEHAARRGLPKEGEELDLSNVVAILNGSEPVSEASMKKFLDAFEPYGLSPAAIKPSYGMAEATLFVSVTDFKKPPTIIHVDRDALNNGSLVPVPKNSPTAVPEASSGQIGIDEWAVIVDPETATEQPDGHVGEIWIHGNNVGSGYWNRDEETRTTFQNILKSRTNPSHAEGAPDDGLWMRTGDLGAYLDGEFYITGRIKDMVIIDGRNHYPQDLEFTAQEACPRAVRAGFVAAFSVPANELPKAVFDNPHAGLKFDPDDTSEQLVVVGERAPGAHKTDIHPIADDIRAAIAVRHGVTVRDVLLVPAGSIPRTSSGKIGHRACRAAYIDGSLRGGYAQVDAFPDSED